MGINCTEIFNNSLCLDFKTFSRLLPLCSLCGKGSKGKHSCLHHFGKIQVLRNAFISFPELVDEIENCLERLFKVFQVQNLFMAQIQTYSEGSLSLWKKNIICQTWICLECQSKIKISLFKSWSSYKFISWCYFSLAGSMHCVNW